jgi:hypothetical protein
MGSYQLFRLPGLHIRVIRSSNPVMSHVMLKIQKRYRATFVGLAFDPFGDVRDGSMAKTIVNNFL